MRDERGIKDREGGNRSGCVERTQSSCMHTCGLYADCGALAWMCCFVLSKKRRDCLGFSAASNSADSKPKKLYFPVVEMYNNTVLNAIFRNTFFIKVLEFNATVLYTSTHMHFTYNLLDCAFLIKISQKKDIQAKSKTMTIHICIECMYFYLSGTSNDMVTPVL